MAQVELERVSKSFPGVHRGEIVDAVRDVSFTVNDRELVVLVGPSGCGKSTTLRLIAGLEDLTDGTIKIDGRVVNNVHPKDRDIAMVFQNFALYPHMTVFENIAFPLKLRKVKKPERRERVLEVAEMLELTDLLERKPEALSGGQRQRVAVGRAIVRKPKVFLFDEPLSNLDAKMRVQMRMEISRLHRQLDATMIYVTHDQVEAMTMGDRIVVMNKGEVCQVADPMTLYREPDNLFTAGFIGSPPMNLLRGRLEKNDGTLQLIAADAKLALETSACSSAEQHVGNEIILGIRPEHVGISPEGPINGTIQLVEPLGAETLVHLDTPFGPVISRCPAHTTFKPGESAAATLDQSHSRLFDPVSESVLP